MCAVNASIAKSVRKEPKTCNESDVRSIRDRGVEKMTELERLQFEQAALRNVIETSIEEFSTKYGEYQTRQVIEGVSRYLWGR